jgi:hypothetical protein
MSFKLSTGLRNYLLSMGSLRKAFENGVLKIYSGSAPASADDAATGVLLCTITKASGTVSANEKGSQKITKITITSTDTLTTVTLDGVAYSFNPGGSMTVINLAINLVRVINETCPMCVAVASGQDGTLNVMSRVDGETFTSAATANCTLSDNVAAVDSDCLSFEDEASSGVLEKNSDTWSGVNVATGTAGYFRLITSSDSGGSSATEKRVQGNISTSGSDMNLSNLNLTQGATLTIDTFTVTLPAYAA